MKEAKTNSVKNSKRVTVSEPKTIEIDFSSAHEMEERCLRTIKPYVEMLHDWREKSSRSTTNLG